MIADNFSTDELQPVRRNEKEIAQLIKERLIGASLWAASARDAVAVHASHRNSVIIRGEQGTGKEYLARLIHECSSRHDGPFVSVSALSVSGESLEAALFGSITRISDGRSRVQRGLVDRVKGGVLYVYRISRISSALKAKLARLSKDREFRRLGSEVVESADVRIIYGSQPLSHFGQGEKAPAEATVIGVADTFEIPPLRKRRNDVEPLSRYFANQMCNRLGKERRSIHRDALVLLRRYDWPGNVGELKRVIERMVRQSRPPALDPSLLPIRITEKDGPAHYSLPDSGMDLAGEMRRMEVAILTEALKQAHGVQAHAARLLGLSLTTLHAKLARYGINVSLFK